MTTLEHPFAVILIRDEEPQIIFSGDGTTVTSEDPPIEAVYTSLRCQECGLISLIPGYLDEVSRHDRSMGREAIHVSYHDQPCSYCGSRISGEVEFSEYPRNFLQPYQFTSRENVEYSPVPGLMDPFQDLGKDVSNTNYLTEELGLV